MGNAMTYIGRITVRKTRRFNVHNRAENYLKKYEDKPVRAPLFEATMKEVDRLAKGTEYDFLITSNDHYLQLLITFCLIEMPDLSKEIKKKDEGLLSNLREVYVTSDGDNKVKFIANKCTMMKFHLLKFHLYYFQDSFSKATVDASAEARSLEAVSPKKEVIEAVPPGKYTLEQAITLIQKYQTNPFHNGHDELAKQFNLPTSVVG